MKKFVKYAFLGMFSLATILSPNYSYIKPEKSKQRLEQKVDKYYDYEEYLDKMQQLRTKYGDIVELIPLEPKTWQGRTIYVLKISDEDLVRDGAIKNSIFYRLKEWYFKDRKPKKKDLREPQVLFFGAMHSNEVISANVTFGIAEYLVENYAKDEKIKNLVDNREVYVIPVLNPDGMSKFLNDVKKKVYSNWRKNCRDNNNDGRIEWSYNSRFIHGSDGVDLNRNFSVAWGEGTSSKDSVAYDYAGPSAFSEPETQAFKDLVEGLDNLIASMNFHSYSAYILYPPFYRDVEIKDEKLLNSLAEGMRKRQNDKYTAMPGCNLYYAGGTADDWLYLKKGVLAFTVEIGKCRMNYNPFSGIYYHDYNPPEEDIKKEVENNVPMAIYLLEIADNPKKVLEKRF